MRNIVACFLHVTHVTDVTEIHAQFLNTLCISSVSELSCSRMTHQRENSKKALLQILDVSVSDWKNDDKDWEKLLLQYTVSRRSEIFWTGRRYIGTIVNFFLHSSLSLSLGMEKWLQSLIHPQMEIIINALFYTLTHYSNDICRPITYKVLRPETAPMATPRICHRDRCLLISAYKTRFIAALRGNIREHSIINLVRVSDN